MPRQVKLAEAEAEKTKLASQARKLAGKLKKYEEAFATLRARADEKERRRAKERAAASTSVDATPTAGSIASAGGNVSAGLSYPPPHGAAEGPWR